MVAQQSKKQTENTQKKTKYFMSCSFANSAETTETTTTVTSINEAEGKETDGSGRSHTEKP